MFETLTEVQFKKLFYKTLNKFIKATPNTITPKYQIDIQYKSDSSDYVVNMYIPSDTKNFSSANLTTIDFVNIWLTIDKTQKNKSLYCYEYIKETIDKKHNENSETSILCDMTLIIEHITSKLFSETIQSYKKNE